jgi:NADPH:quinone reductase-like Zn-dependent oxidoreductase
MDFEVGTDDLRRHRVVDDPIPELANGQVLLHVEHAALTANNITYGAFGDAMRYWHFFPAEDGWGRIPVWGFAEVLASRADGVRPGERVYGYLPMSTHLVVQPSKVTSSAFVDGAEHRNGLATVYNQYLRVSGADEGGLHAEHVRAILRPLFTTSFLIDDWLAGEEFFGAASVMIGSASSKTSLGLASLLHDRAGIDVVGLTSQRNADFVRDVGYYDRVVTYSSVADLGPSTPTVFVDMAGDAEVIAEVHHHFADDLRHSCQVGATHWEQVGSVGPLPGPTPSFFFAPAHVTTRVREWGSAGFDERVDAAWRGFSASAERWMTVVEHRGAQAVAEAYLAVLEGHVAPDQAFIISLEP